MHPQMTTTNYEDSSCKMKHTASGKYFSRDSVLHGYFDTTCRFILFRNENRALKSIMLNCQ